MYIYIYIYINIHICTYICVHVHTHIRFYAHVCILWLLHFFLFVHDASWFPQLSSRLSVCFRLRPSLASLLIHTLYNQTMFLILTTHATILQSDRAYTSSNIVLSALLLGFFLFLFFMRVCHHFLSDGQNWMTRDISTSSSADTTATVPAAKTNTSECGLVFWEG